MSERWPGLLTKEQACEYLGIGETKLTSLRASEQIKSVRIGERIIRYRKTDLDRFIDELAEEIGEFQGTSR